MLLDRNDVEKILQRNSSWTDVAEPLARVCSQARLGIKMFGWALTMVSAETFSKQCARYLESMRGI